jgi:DNA repair protein RadC
MLVGVEPPELELLVPVLGLTLAAIVASQPGGWRSLSLHELSGLGLSDEGVAKVIALQVLSRRSCPPLPTNRVLRPEDVAAVFVPRLGRLDTEHLVMIALDAKNHARGEFVVASGGCASLSVTPADVLRPALRAGAVSIIVVHNHPSGDATPSEDDLRMTLALADVAAVVGIQLVDHVVVARDGFRSLAHSIEARKKEFEHVDTAESGPRTH